MQARTNLHDREYELLRRALEDEELAKKAIKEYREALREASACGRPPDAIKNRVHQAVSRYQASLKRLSRLRDAGRNSG
jgi:hypothetical protein